MIKLLFCIAALNYTLSVSMCFVTWDVCMRTAFHYFCCKWPGNETGNDTLPPQYDKSAYSSIAAIWFYRLNWSHTPFIEHIHTHKHSHAACAYIAVHEHIHSHVFEFVTTITLSKPPKACVWSYEPGAVSWRFFCGMPSSCQLTSPIQHVFGFISCMNVQEENVQKVKLWVYTPYCRA